MLRGESVLLRSGYTADDAMLVRSCGVVEEFRHS